MASRKEYAVIFHAGGLAGTLRGLINGYKDMRPEYADKEAYIPVSAFLPYLEILEEAFRQYAGRIDDDEARN